MMLHLAATGPYPSDTQVRWLQSCSHSQNCLQGGLGRGGSASSRRSNEETSGQGVSDLDNCIDCLCVKLRLVLPTSSPPPPLLLLLLLLQVVLPLWLVSVQQHPSADLLLQAASMAALLLLLLPSCQC